MNIKFFVSILSVLLLVSCTSQRLVFSDKPSRIDLKKELLYTDTKKPLSLDSNLLNQLVTNEIALDAEPELKKYVKKILKESESENDTLLAVSPRLLILKTENIKNFKSDYLNLYDAMMNTWEGYMQNMPGMRDGGYYTDPHYFTKIYRAERGRRVLAKSVIEDVTLIHVIQGKRSGIPYQRVSYNPADFINFLDMVWKYRDEVSIDRRIKSYFIKN